MSLLQQPWAQILDSDGNPYPNAKLHTYEAGTTTDKPTYQDTRLTTKHENPITSDPGGVFANVYLGEGEYKLVFKDQFGATVYTADNLSPTGGNQVYAISAPPTSAQTILSKPDSPQGHIMFLPNTDLTGDSPVCRIRAYPNQGDTLFSLNVGTVTVETTTWDDLINRFANFTILSIPAGLTSTDSVKLSRVPLTWTRAQALSLLASGETTATAAFNLYRDPAETKLARVGYFKTI